MTIFRTVAVAFTTLLIASAAIAIETRGEPRDEIIYSMLSQFWGQARDVHGKPIQPASDKERTTVPVPMPVAYRALEAGETSGMAEWCGLDWEPHYFSLTKVARSHEMSDTQVAFISVLHGAAQENFVHSMQGRICNNRTKTQAERRLKQSAKELMAVSLTSGSLHERRNISADKVSLQISEGSAQHLTLMVSNATGSDLSLPADILNGPRNPRRSVFIQVTDANGKQLTRCGLIEVESNHMHDVVVKDNSALGFTIPIYTLQRSYCAATILVSAKFGQLLEDDSVKASSFSNSVVVHFKNARNRKDQ